MPAQRPAAMAPMPVRCPRCRGRVHSEQDHHGSYLTCLMCGYTRDLTSTAVIELDDVSDTETDRTDTPATPGRSLR